MTHSQKELLLAIAAALQCPRNRFGKIEVGNVERARLDQAAHALGIRQTLPHGGLDTPDQIAMYLQGLVGVKMVSMVRV